MTSMDKYRLLEKVNCNSPANATVIQRIESQANFRLPVDYVQFLREANGGEGFVGDSYIILWRVDELLELNAAYQVAEYAPGLFLFGSDGGGEAFAFDKRIAEPPIVSVPFVGMDLQLIRRIASNFAEFLEKLARS